MEELTPILKSTTPISVAGNIEEAKKKVCRMSRFTVGQIVVRESHDLGDMPQGSVHKVVRLTGPSTIMLCNGMSYHEDNFGPATNVECEYYEDAVKTPKPDNSLGAMEQQEGGDHYKKLGVQPMELVLVNMGYEAFRGACYTKINKYMIRDKDAEVGQLKKAAHVLQMWIEEAEKQANA